MTTTSSVVIGSPKEYIPAQDNMVEVTIKYPKDWAKEKFFEDGDIKSVSLEVAEQFAAAGIIEIVETGVVIVPVLVEVKPSKKAK